MIQDSVVEVEVVAELLQKKISIRLQHPEARLHQRFQDRLRVILDQHLDMASNFIPGSRDTVKISILDFWKIPMFLENSNLPVS